jgi:alpha-glucuronidase
MVTALLLRRFLVVRAGTRVEDPLMNDSYLQILPVRPGTSERCVPASRVRRRVRPRSAGLRRAAPGLLALLALVVLAGACAAPAARAEDGYDLWLRYVPVEGRWLARYREASTQLVMGPAPSATLRAARAELARGLKGMLGAAPPGAQQVSANGAIILGTPASSPVIARMHLDLSRLGSDGYVIRSVTVAGHRATLIAGKSDVGALNRAER